MAQEAPGEQGGDLLDAVGGGLQCRRGGWAASGAQGGTWSDIQGEVGGLWQLHERRSPIRYLPEESTIHSAGVKEKFWAQWQR